MARHRFDLDEWERTGSPSAERYRNRRTGEELSRRQMENRRARASGWESWSEYQRVRRKGRGIHRFTEMAEEEKGISSRKLAAPESKFMQKYRKAYRAGFTTGKSGAFADFLEYIEVRPKDADYQVGDTP